MHCWWSMHVKNKYSFDVSQTGNVNMLAVCENIWQALAGPSVLVAIPKI